MKIIAGPCVIESEKLLREVRRNLFVLEQPMMIWRYTLKQVLTKPTERALAVLEVLVLNKA